MAYGGPPQPPWRPRRPGRRAWQHAVGWPLLGFAVLVGVVPPSLHVLGTEVSCGTPLVAVSTRNKHVDDGNPNNDWMDTITGTLDDTLVQECQQKGAVQLLVAGVLGLSGLLIVVINPPRPAPPPYPPYPWPYPPGPPPAA